MKNNKEKKWKTLLSMCEILLLIVIIIKFFVSSIEYPTLDSILEKAMIIGLLLHGYFAHTVIQSRKKISK